MTYYYPFFNGVSQKASKLHSHYIVVHVNFNHTKGSRIPHDTVNNIGEWVDIESLHIECAKKKCDLLSQLDVFTWWKTSLFLLRRISHQVTTNKEPLILEEKNLNHKTWEKLGELWNLDVNQMTQESWQP
jgi:hypothetical protein